MNKVFTKLIFLIALLETSTSVALSTEYPSKADIEKLFVGSECILLVEFEGYEKKKDVSLLNPPVAIYRITEYFWGSSYGSFGSSIKVQYPFDVEPRAARKWKFKPALMPSKGSKWILFFADSVTIDGALSTYKGSKGRIECSEKNLEALLIVIEARKSSRASGRAKTRDNNEQRAKNNLLYLRLDKPYNRDKLKEFIEGRSNSYSGIDARPIYIKKVRPKLAR